MRRVEGMKAGGKLIKCEREVGAMSITRSVVAAVVFPARRMAAAVAAVPPCSTASSWRT